MPELSHDTAEDGFHEIQLSGKELVFLFLLVTGASVLIFLCGVLVGRGARTVRGEDAPQETAAAAPAPVAPAPQVTPGAGPVTTEAPSPAEEGAALSYPKRLQGIDEPKDELKRAQAAAESKPAAPPPAQPEAKRPAPTPPPAEKAPADTKAAAGADVPASGRPGAWVVQVVALQDRSVATSLVKRLNGKGYPAFLVTTAAGSVPRMYKVQVGRFNDKKEAEQIRQRLEKEEQFKPWISR